MGAGQIRRAIERGLPMIEFRAAAGDGTVSGWLADAAERKLRAQGLGRVVDEWEAEHGAFTEVELAAAERELRPKRRR